ncbi:hypothetical protein [Nostoc sp. UIC 10630]|uniref:hypothetical protein n=1 Tax=Nostoc sp. UIC 10630 TaxID=2100146 RepID=UPI0013D39D6A|nr:hypothetical protein [Nostoc sp. UIC 10630]NEU83215.1 hypothetical protein [Nostoc sp. UIC 10630]
MRVSTDNVIVPLTVAIIGLIGVLGAAWIAVNGKTNTEAHISLTSDSECNQTSATKVCISHITVQFNSNEPQQVKNRDRIPLKAGDILRLSNISYCIPSKALVNRVEVKSYLFPNGVENYKNGLFTPNTFLINAGCNNIGNFQKTWKLQPGQHRVNIPIIKYVGSNRIVDSSFNFDLDVGR